MIVAIDGPAGAGKSTVARAVAARLGFEYLDTGAQYRLVALAAITSGVDPGDGPRLAELAGTLTSMSTGERFAVTRDPSGKDASERIRDPDVTAIVPQVSGHPEVRAALLELQRAKARSGDVVIEGRDIGSTVVPEAEVKVFLTASPRERALRRIRQLEMPETEAAVAEMEQAIRERDHTDATRTSSPLVKAPDAVEVDSTGMSLDEVIDTIVALVEERR